MTTERRKEEKTQWLVNATIKEGVQKTTPKPRGLYPSFREWPGLEAALHFLGLFGLTDNAKSRKWCCSFFIGSGLGYLAGD